MYFEGKPLHLTLESWISDSAEPCWWKIIPKLEPPPVPLEKYQDDSTRAILFSLTESTTAAGCLVIPKPLQMDDNSLLEMLEEAYEQRAGWSCWVKWQGVKSIQFASVRAPFHLVYIFIDCLQFQKTSRGFIRKPNTSVASSITQANATLFGFPSRIKSQFAATELDIYRHTVIARSEYPAHKLTAEMKDNSDSQKEIWGLELHGGFHWPSAIAIASLLISLLAACLHQRITAFFKAALETSALQQLVAYCNLRNGSTGELINNADTIYSALNWVILTPMLSNRYYQFRISTLCLVIVLTKGLSSASFGSLPMYCLQYCLDQDGVFNYSASDVKNHRTWETLRTSFETPSITNLREWEIAVLGVTLAACLLSSSDLGRMSELAESFIRIMILPILSYYVLYLLAIFCRMLIQKLVTTRKFYAEARYYETFNVRRKIRKAGYRIVSMSVGFVISMYCSSVLELFHNTIERLSPRATLEWLEINPNRVIWTCRAVFGISLGIARYRIPSEHKFKRAICMTLLAAIFYHSILW
jgi:hypothetical protein